MFRCSKSIGKLLCCSRISANQLMLSPSRHCGWEPNIYSNNFDKKYETYFNKPDIDGWEIRKHMNDILGMDLVPEPKIIIAALKACRRVNDYALAVRWLEGCREKCGNERKTIYPWLLQEIRPTLNELGVSTPEEMGYDCPELALETLNDMDPPASYNNK